jgi:DinB superfamily
MHGEQTMKIRILFFAVCAMLVAVSISIQPTKVVSAQESPNAKAATAVRKGFSEVSNWVTKSAEIVPAEKYNYKPVDTVRSFGQIIGHITDSYNYFCAHAAGNKVKWADPAEKGTTDKATLVPKLKDAVDKCNAVYASDTADIAPLLENVSHTSLHYGNLITYMRMMGMKPPSS